MLDQVDLVLAECGEAHARAPRVPRMMAMAFVLVLIVMASYIVVGRDQIAALGLSVYPDPFMSFSSSRSEATSGSVIELEGAPGGAWVEFSGDGVRAYAPTFATRSGVATVVPPVFRGSTVGPGDLEVRVLSRRGPIWTSSMRKAFTVAAPDATETRLGAPSLFTLQVLHGLLTNAADAASIAAAAGAPDEVNPYASALSKRRLEVDALARQFEMVAWGNSQRVTVPGMTLNGDGVRLMDELAAQYFETLGQAGSSLCGGARDQAGAGLGARDSVEAIAAAARFSRSIVECDAGEVRELTARTRAWLLTLSYSSAEKLRIVGGLSKVGALLQIAVVSWGDEAISATYLWKQYDATEELRSFRLDRAGASVLPDSLRNIAEGEPYLSQQLAGIAERWALEDNLIGSIVTHGEARERVTSALAERVPVLATPSSIPVPPIPIRQGVRLCGTLSEHRSPTSSQPGSLTIDGERFTIATEARENLWSEAREGTKVCMLGTWVASPNGRTLIGDLTIGAFSSP